MTPLEFKATWLRDPDGGRSPQCAMAFTQVFLILTFSVALIDVRTTAPQQLDPVTDPDAYAIYAMLVPPAWATRSKDTLLLQQETEISFECHSAVSALDDDWATVEQSFRQENSRVRTLQPMLPISIPYRLVPRAEIEADDARLALKYPGIWQRRPESMEYAAVSAVGFNQGKTKAMVYVRLRSGGGINLMEIREGKWVNAPRGGCGWIA